jgi:phospholipase/carboxylesterase
MQDKKSAKINRPGLASPVARLLLAVSLLIGCCQSEAGCAKTPRNSHSASAQTKSSEPGLEHVEMLTAGARPDQKLPLIAAVHGLGDRPENFKEVLTDLPIPARVVLPRAPQSHGSGFAWFSVRLFEGDWDRLSKGISRAADQVAEWIGHLEKTTPTKGRPILCGFSQGGMISFAVAVKHPRAAGFVIPISGTLPRQLWPQSEPKDKSAYPPIRALHGAADELVPIEPTRKAVGHLKELGFDAELTSYPGVSHTVAPSMRQELFDLIKDRSMIERDAQNIK